jgi:acetyl esterase/lipase
MTEASLGETLTGVHVLDIPARFGALARRLARKVANRAMQALTGHVLRRGLTVRARGPEALQSYLDAARGRAALMDGGMMPAAAAGAVRVRPETLGYADPSPGDWFSPRTAPSRGLVFYVHGGSFVTERSPKITELVGRFAASAQARVFSPSYRLAPEHPCPAAVDDIVAAWRWLRRAAPDEPVVALAESAGAAILMAALQQVRDEGDPLPAGVVLLSPWLDLSLQSWSVMAASISGASPYTMESLAMMAHFYLQGRAATDPIASPLFGDFRGLPPLLVHASRNDILFDDAVRLTDRVRDANGDLTVRFWIDETHVWERRNSPEARQSISLAAQFIRARLTAAMGT